MIEINGKEYGFMLTGGAAVEIAKMCPDNDLDNFAEAMTGKDTEETMKKQFRFASIMNDGFVEFERLMGREAAKLDEKTFFGNPFAIYLKIKDAAFDAFVKGMNGEIDAEPTDSKNAETGATD